MSDNQICPVCAGSGATFVLEPMSPYDTDPDSDYSTKRWVICYLCKGDGLSPAGRIYLEELKKYAFSKKIG